MVTLQQERRAGAVMHRTETSTTTRSRPSLWGEQRAGWELMELLASPVYYGIGVPRGDGAPVLLIPGFLGSDDYLVTLRGWLRRIGYRPFSSGLHCIEPLARLRAQLLGRVEAVAGQARRPLVLIGHSLGGMLACGVAQQRPDLVRQVVTLGTARCPDAVEEAADPMVHALAELLLRPGDARHAGSLLHGLIDGPLPDDVSLACLYSREDAVVDWRACLDTDPRTVLQEVRGTHTGLAWNVAVYRHLAHLLADG